MRSGWTGSSVIPESLVIVKGGFEAENHSLVVDEHSGGDFARVLLPPRPILRCLMFFTRPEGRVMELVAIASRYSVV
jgi:hypothetical protein